MQDDREPGSAEAREWIDAISSVIAFEGTGRADDLLTAAAWYYG